MPGVRSSLGHQFTASPVDKTAEVDTFINVIKRREEILYRTSLPPQAANVAHVSSGEVSSTDNLSIADRSTSLAANRVREGAITTVTATKTFTIDTENFVVTDVFTSPSQTIVEVPLFYKHVLSTENIPRDLDGDISSGTQLLSVEFLDNVLSPVGTPEMVVDYTQGIIYNNMQSEYSTSSNYTIYFVKYTINQGNEVKTFVDLLNNVTTYRIATFDDLTAALQIKTDGRKVYLIEEVAGQFVVTLPIVGTYAFKPTARSRIRILPAVATSITDPWYVRVTNGKFFTNIGGTLYKYHIAEFLSQSFTPEPPIKQSSSEESVILTDSLIKLDHQNIYQGTDHALYVTVLVNNRDDEGLAAFTTDGSIVDNIAANGQPYQKWTNSERVGIRSIDHSTGVLQIEGIELRSSYKIVSTYSFEEENYEVTILDFNPISNKEALTTHCALFIDPDTSATSKTQTLYYLKIDQSGRVIESNWVDFDNDSSKYQGTHFLYYERLPDFLQTTEPLEPNYIDPAFLKYFVSEFSVEGGAGATEQFLILGDVSTNEALGIDDVEMIDTRKRGGGLLESILETALLDYPESAWFWDNGYWDGIPYPGNASYMVEVPVSIMEGAGGRFLASEIREIVHKHTAFGVYPIVKAYGVDIDYTAISIFNSIRVEWNGKNAGEYSSLAADSALRHAFYIGSISRDTSIGHQFTIPSASIQELGHSFNTILVSDAALSHQFETINPGPLDAIFQGTWTNPHPYDETLVSRISSASLTPGHRYIVMATGSSNVAGYGMHHEFKFGGTTDPDIELWHRNYINSSGLSSAGQSNFFMKKWTAVAGQNIDWIVNSYHPGYVPTYSYSWRDGYLMAIDMDSPGMVENQDWFYADHNTPKYNLNGVYADNVGATITFTPDGTSDYLVVANGQQMLTDDGADYSASRRFWMQLYDSTDGQISEMALNLCLQGEPGSQHSYHSVGVLEAPSASSRTISLRFRSDPSYPTFDYKYSSIWIYRLNKSASYAYDQGIRNDDTNSANEITISSASFTPKNGSALVFGQAEWYSKSTSYSTWQRLRYNGALTNETYNSMPSYNASYPESVPDGPWMGTISMRKLGSGQGLVVDTPGTIALSHDNLNNTPTQWIRHYCLVMLDLNLR